MTVSSRRIEVYINNAKPYALGDDGTYDIHDKFRPLQDL